MTRTYQCKPFFDAAFYLPIKVLSGPAVNPKAHVGYIGSNDACKEGLVVMANMRDREKGDEMRGGEMKGGEEERIKLIGKRKDKMNGRQEEGRPDQERM